ncbi:hypothetical protein C8Q79DRAFT_896641 [Trametes meyenii]|nr:hypothetical protein C8Q79DRAFT_896641 [Trametes meyenii]
MNADRESFIDLASPTFSPLNAEFSIPPLPDLYTEHSIHSTHHDSSNDFNHGESPSRTSRPRLPRLVPPVTSAEKPPLPTTPKPDFSRRSRSMQAPSSGKPSKSSPVHAKHANSLSTFASDLDRSLSGLNTTNSLSPRERAQRVRTTHKLTQVFGQTPGVSPVSPATTHDALLPPGCMPIANPLTLNLNLPGKRKHQHQHHRPAVSMSEEVVTPVFDTGGEQIWPPPDGTRYVSLQARRHSAPLSPDEFSFMLGRRSDDSAGRSSNGGGGGGGGGGVYDGESVIEIGPAEGAPQGDRASLAGSGRWTGDEGPGSPTSFMDLSDEEGNDGMSELLAETPRGPRGRRGSFGRGRGGDRASLSDSLSLDAEQLAEDERRRKREKLAKLHRFLGSRVPQHLVLGPLDEGTPLPPPAPSPFNRAGDNGDDGDDARRAKMRRRRSSSAAEFSRTWSDDIDRLKEELNEREKAINVRRAVKMEKMFGVAPPQTLYHTRAPPPSSSSLGANLTAPSPRLSPRSPSSPAFRFTASGPAPKKKKSSRPGTSDSSKPLMSDSPDNGLLDPTRSSVYMHYRHSLNSLNDIIDRDDRESLAELHDYLSGHQLELTGPTSPILDDLAVSTPTPKAERRRSLPSRTSIASFTSEISMLIATPPPGEHSFQQRRRRAAKLTHFFGVDYRDLMSEVLESIEKGLEEERGKGTLKPDEVRDLQQKLVNLKTKRNSLR